MNQKYFQLDKNYILKDVQTNQMDELLKYMVDNVVKIYLLKHNPLGLQDDPILKISNYKVENVAVFAEFYELLAGIYRYKIGTNQLEFLFDGKSHQEKYLDDWKNTFNRWIKTFGEEERFIKIVLSMTVFYEDEYSAQLAQNRLKHFLCNHFKVKIYRYKGIMNQNVA